MLVLSASAATCRAIHVPRVISETIAVQPAARRYATLCAVAGVDATDEPAARAGLPPIDSINQWPVLAGNVGELVRARGREGRRWGGEQGEDGGVWSWNCYCT